MPSNAAGTVAQMNLTLLLPTIVSKMAESADVPKAVTLESAQERSAHNRSEADPQRR